MRRAHQKFKTELEFLRGGRRRALAAAQPRARRATHDIGIDPFALDRLPQSRLD